MSFETDITGIKKILEAEPLFKPAGEGALAARAEQQRLEREAKDANRGNTDYCPKCGSDLRDDDTGGMDSLVTEYHNVPMVYNPEDDLFESNWDGHDTFVDSDTTGYVCRKCHHELKYGEDFNKDNV